MFTFKGTKWNQLLTGINTIRTIFKNKPVLTLVVYTVILLFLFYKHIASWQDQTRWTVVIVSVIENALFITSVLRPSNGYMSELR